LIRCHVENFGKLQDFSVDFSQGIHTVCQENSWGKSTLAAFIRAMFYGLEGERKRNIEENERKRYKPWQGGAFGGSLTFETNGKQYVISRIFHEKETQDEFELRDAVTNLISQEYSSKLGEELFHINRESFMRTVFISQGDCGTAITDDINAQIGNLADNANDLNSFEAAYARLTEQINSVTPHRVTGNLAKRAGEITKVERIVEAGSRIGESLETYRGYLQKEEETYASLKEQMEEVCDLQGKVSSLQVVVAKQEEWTRLKNTLDRRQKEWMAAKEVFPGEIPSVQEADAAFAEALSLEKMTERVALYSMGTEETEEWERLQQVFSKGLPEKEKATELLEKTKELIHLRRQQAEICLTEEENRRLEELECIFSKETEDITEIISLWNDCMKKKAALPANQAVWEALQASKQAEESIRKKKNTLAAVGLAAGCLVLLGGILTGILISAMPGGIAAAAGALIISISVIVLRKIKKDTNPEEAARIKALENTIREDEQLIQDTENYVWEYVDRCSGLTDGEQIEDILQEIAGEYYAYTNLAKKKERQQQWDRSEEINRLRQEIAEYLFRYQMEFSEENMWENLHGLLNKAERYVVLREKAEQGNVVCGEYAKVMQSICAFLKKYHYFPENDLRKQIVRIKEDIDSYMDCQRWSREASETLEAFEKANVSVLERKVQKEGYPSLEELNQKIQNLTGDMEKCHAAIISYNRRLEDLQEQYDEWEESKLYLEELKELQSTEKKKYELLMKTRTYLALAKESITAKYAAPIFQNFSRYFEYITGNSAEKYRMDANTTLTVEEKGKQREINTLSTGYRDLVGICLRVALVDAMYTKETPILMMDDPFTNLDDKKMAAALDFLQEISKKYQIIYFTCSKGRI